MDMAFLSEALIALFLVISGIFGLVGSFGLVKLRETMQRLHAPTKATTLGVGGVLIASMLYFLLVKGNLSFHELLITLFLFLTAPIIAGFIGKTYMLHHIAREDLPTSGRDYGWALYDAAPGEAQDDSDKT